MTIWRTGMSAAVVCNDWFFNDGGGAVPNPPEIGDVFIVRGVKRAASDTSNRFKKIFSKKICVLKIAGFGWVTAHVFRPVDEQENNADIVTAIKACKPRKVKA